MTVEAKVGVMHLSAKDYNHQNLGRGRKDPPLETLERALILDSWSPELETKKCLLL